MSHVLFSFDDSDDLDHPALVTFIGGSEALRLSDLTEPELVASLLAHLTSLLGSWVNHYTDITVKNWADEEWIGGERGVIILKKHLLHSLFSFLLILGWGQ